MAWVLDLGCSSNVMIKVAVGVAAGGVYILGVVGHTLPAAIRISILYIGIAA